MPQSRWKVWATLGIVFVHTYHGTDIALQTTLHILLTETWQGWISQVIDYISLSNSEGAKATSRKPKGQWPFQMEVGNTCR